MDEESDLIPTRQSLLERLKDVADDASWTVFFETYWRLIYHTGLKAGLTEVEAQDLVQETVISVFKSMEAFTYERGHGSFKHWLLKLTHWRIQDQLRKRQRGLAIPTRPRNKDTETIARIPDPNSSSLDATWDEEWTNNLLHAAVERVKRKVDPKQWQIFELCTFKQWPVSRISHALGISAAKVYIIRHRLKKVLKKELDELEKNPL
jgi:RNA polymerase sigma factor (sigma-70 family)